MFQIIVEGSSKRSRSRSRRPAKRRQSNRKGIITTGVPRNMVKCGFPSSALVHMKYVENFTMAVPNTGVQLYVFSANGIYDPNITGTGH